MAGAVLLAGAALRAMRTLGLVVAGLLERRPGLLRCRLMHHRLVRPMVGLVHGRLGVMLGRLMVRRGLGLVVRRLMDRRGMMRLGMMRGLVVVVLGRRRRRRAIVMLVRRGRRRCYMMDHRGIIVDQINVFGRDDATDERKGHHTGDAGGNEAHRASFYKVVAFVSLS